MSEDMNYEDALARLEEIVKILEDNKVSLDDALKLFEEGAKLTALCNKKLNDAKQKIIEIEKE